MLTPKKIRGYQFQSAGRGCYKAGEVDEFFEQVVDSFEQVFKENGELVRKMGLLATKLEEYRKDEDNIRRALLNAQKMSDKIIDEAKSEGAKIIDEADRRAKNVDYTINAKIKVMVDEVEAEMKVAFRRATEQAEAIKHNAQKESEKILTNAKLRAQSMVDEAAKLSKDNLDQIVKDIETEKVVLSQLKNDSNKFKAELKARYQKQLIAIDATPEYVIEIISQKVQQEETSDSVLSDADKQEVTRLVDSFVASQSETIFNSTDFFKKFNYKGEDEETVVDAVEDSDENVGVEMVEADDEFVFEDFPIEAGNPKFDTDTDPEFQDVFSYDVSSNEVVSDEFDGFKVNFSADFSDNSEHFDFDDRRSNEVSSDETDNFSFKSPDFSSEENDDDGVIYISKKRNKSNAQTTSTYSPDAFIKQEENADSDSDNNIFGGFSINMDDLDSISEKDTDSIFSGFFK